MSAEAFLVRYGLMVDGEPVDLGTRSRHATLIDAANAWVKLDAPIKKIAQEIDGELYELSAEQEAFADAVADKLGYEVETLEL